MDLSFWMGEALQLAQEGFDADEVPIGAVLVSHEGKRLSQAHNQGESWQQPTAHAEILALQSGCFERETLQKATLFVTLEPCPMCMGAILLSHVGHLVYGASNLKWGACGAVLDFRNHYRSNLKVTAGIQEKACSDLLHMFFSNKR